MAEKTTPMISQYMAIKEEYADCLLFFRMGDFYELFFEDAKIASAALEITLTKRGSHNDEPIPMCGVPHHAYSNYLAKLVSQGFKVAICDQVEDPKTAIGIVRREVVQVVSQGTFTDPDHLSAKENNFLAACDPTGYKNNFGLAWLDLSTGQFSVKELSSRQELAAEISRLLPSEILLPNSVRYDSIFNEIADSAGLGPGRSIHVEFVNDDSFNRNKAVKRILEHFGKSQISDLGIDYSSSVIGPAGACLAYVKGTQKTNTGHITRVSVDNPDNYLQVDDVTARHLELFRTLSGARGQGTLVHVLDKTATAMGGRMLRNWIGSPLNDIKLINKRQKMVSVFFNSPMLREELKNALMSVADLERLCARITMRKANPREIYFLKNSARAIPEIKRIIQSTGSNELTKLADTLDDLADVAELVDQAIIDDPPPLMKNGGFIRNGYNEELDELVGLVTDGQSYIAELEKREQEKTGINSLKVKYNKVFGYYLEVSKTNLDKVPDTYHRKQTLVNAERFVTDELAEYEHKVISASENRITLEFELFEDLRTRLSFETDRIQKSAAIIASIDVLACLAEVAQLRSYSMPRLTDDGQINLVGCRHPVVEAEFTEEPFVPNDVKLDMRSHQVHILTGPNMAGKSTILRQVALCVLMAQMGGFVPAENAEIGLVDRIFTRVGAGDELARGRSTFMVEMSETARILLRATPKSLVVLDEIGRGTSTFDGLAIAWAIAEYLHDLEDKGVKTLMATHYHELVELTSIKKRVVNYTVAVKKIGRKIVFLRTLRPGGVSRSYGIEVAQLAGLPAAVIRRAREVLLGLEDGATGNITEHLEDTIEPMLFSASAKPDMLRRRLGEIELNETTPMEAMNLLAELKDLL